MCAPTNGSYPHNSNIVFSNDEIQITLFAKKTLDQSVTVCNRLIPTCKFQGIRCCDTYIKK